MRSVTTVETEDTRIERRGAPGDGGTCATKVHIDRSTISTEANTAGAKSPTPSELHLTSTRAQRSCKVAHGFIVGRRVRATRHVEIA